MIGVRVLISRAHPYFHLVISALLDLVLAFGRRLETRAGRVGVIAARKDAGIGHDRTRVMERRNAYCGRFGSSPLARIQDQAGSVYDASALQGYDG